MRSYNITKHNNDFFKVKVTDEYGCSTTVYEKNVFDASRFVYDWWESAKERKKTNDLMNKAILNCIELDKKGGLLKDNRDGLD
tara:strand:- start:1241 stop:1489 length:249 start_codon:yes stop_codon:yes gene_type:complete